MPDIFGNVQQQLNDFWQSLDKGQKGKLITVVLLSLLIIIIGVYALSRPSYVELYIGLDTKELAEVTAKLDEVGVKYKVSDNARNLLVEKSQKVKAQMELAKANMPSGDAKYADAFTTKTSFGATESDKKREYLEYKAREIQVALIANSSAISDAKVFLNIADNTSFFGDDSKSTASVQIKPNGELSPSQIEGIARFVANSVSELDPKNVEVVDNNMNVLKDFDDPFTKGADKQYTLTQQQNSNLEKKIRELLANNPSEYDEVKVVANLVLDFDTMTEDGRKYEPVIDGTGAIVSQNEQKEELINGTTGGVPGTDSNDGTVTYPTEGTSSGSSYTSSDTTTNYVYNERIYSSTKAIGKPDTGKSSIAVSLFYGNKVESVPNQEVINKVINLVSAAASLPKENISVESFQMAKEIIEEPSINFMLYIREYGIFALSLILVILLGVGVVTGSSKKLSFESELPEVVQRKTAKERIEEIQLEESSEVTKQIDKFIKQKPEAVAQLLRNWLTEDWE